MNGYVSQEGRQLPERQGPDQQLEIDQLEQLYSAWKEEVFTGDVAPDLRELVMEAGRDPAAQDHLVTKLSGYLALIALDSDMESPLAAYNHAQAGALELAGTISPRLSKVSILDKLLETAIESAKPDKTPIRTAAYPGIANIKDYRNRIITDSTTETPETDEYNPELERIVALLQSPDTGKRDREEAFAEVVKEYSPKLLGYVSRMTGSTQMGQDIVQEVFLAVFLKMEDFEYRGPKAFRSWLYEIAIHRTLNTVRTGPYKARKTTMQLDEELMFPTGISATEKRGNPEAALEQKEAVRKLVETLNELLPHEKEAIILQEAGWSYEQIGDALGKTLPSIKSLLVRGRLKLNARMEKD